MTKRYPQTRPRQLQLPAQSKWRTPIDFRICFAFVPALFAVLYFPVFWLSYYDEYLSLIQSSELDESSVQNTPPLPSSGLIISSPETTSNPLSYNETSGCFHWNDRPNNPLVNFEGDAKNARGIVVTLVLGTNSKDFLCRFFPSQLTNLIVPQQWDVLLVIGKTIKEPLSKSRLLREELISCLNLTAISSERSRVWHNLDGSLLQTEEFRVQIKNEEEVMILEPRIFLADTELALPQYIQADPSLLKVPMEPRQCQAPIPYIQGTKWYMDEMLHLTILQEYDYFIKLDTDVAFLKPLPIDLIHDMTLRGAIFGHTGQYPNHILAPCGTGITAAVHDYIQQQQQQQQHTPDQMIGLCSHHHPKLAKDADLYYTNFIVGRTDFFQSSLILEFARFLAEYPQGFFRYRWTDQIFWHFAMGLGIANDFEDAVVDYSEFRCAPKRNCWMSVHYYNHDRCDNNGVFFHTKAKAAPLINNSEWTWKEYLDASDFITSTTTTKPQRGNAPYTTQYFDQCQELSL